MFPLFFLQPLVGDLRNHSAEELWLLLLRNQGSRSKEAQLMALEFQTAAMAVGVASRHWGQEWGHVQLSDVQKPCWLQ